MNNQSSEVEEPSTIDASIANAFAVYSRRMAVANGILFAIGISVSLYVYRHYPHPSLIHDETNRPSSETTENYLFAFVAAQAFLFAVPAYQAIFFARTIRNARRREAWLRRNAPYLRSYHSKTLSKVVSTLWVLGSALFLCLTIYHSVLVARGSV
jgi:hypothetical protein